MASLNTIASQLAAQIADIFDQADEVQVVAGFVSRPMTKVVIDIYPADPSQEDAAFGPASSLLAWTVRARAGTADYESASAVLLELMEPHGGASIRGALLGDNTLGGTVETLDTDRPTGFRLYEEVQAGGVFLGFELRVRVYSTNDEAVS